MKKQEKGRAAEADQLAAAIAEAEANLAGWQRAQADYQNLKKETDGRAAEALELGRASLAIGVLPIVDSFAMAERHIPQEQYDVDWVQGILNVKKQLDGFVAELGIERIETAGAKFDPAIHEAVSQEARDGVASDTVVAELQPGYRMGEQVIRPAKVTVAA